MKSRLESNNSDSLKDKRRKTSKTKRQMIWSFDPAFDYELINKIVDEHELWLESKETIGQPISYVGLSFDGAFFPERNLKQSKIAKTTAKGTRFHDVDFSDSDLHYFIPTDARLMNVKFHNTILDHADFTGANLTNTSFKGASLRNTCFTRVTGIIPADLAGTDLTNAQLPNNLNLSDSLLSVGDIAKHAKRLFLIVLMVCSYALLTALTVDDASLLINSFSSKLPIIGVGVPTVAFFTLVPALIWAFFFYFQLYLAKLWRGLSNLPAILQDGTELQDAIYGWLPVSLVRTKFTLLRKRVSLVSRLQNSTTIFLVWIFPPLATIVIWLKTLPRHDWTLSTAQSIVCMVIVVTSAWSYTLMDRKLRGDRLSSIGTLTSKVVSFLKFTALSIAVTSIFGILTYGAIEGRPELSGIAETSKGYSDGYNSSLLGPWNPRKWVPEFLKFPRLRISTVANLRPKTYQLTDIVHGPLVGVDFEYSDLRYADAKSTDFRWSSFYRADLRGIRAMTADFRGADLSLADLRGSFLTGAKFEGAHLNGAPTHGGFQVIRLFKEHSQALLAPADFRAANLEGATGLTARQLFGAILDSSTSLPAYLTVPDSLDIIKSGPYYGLPSKYSVNYLLNLTDYELDDLTQELRDNRNGIFHIFEQPPTID